jgi:hypothetical protein
MSIRVKAAAAALAAALSVTPAFAEILSFTWDYAPGKVATWSQPSNPTPVTFDGVSTLVEVSGANNLGQKFQAVWYDNIEIGNGAAPNTSTCWRFCNRLSDFHRPPVCTDIFSGSISCRIFSRPVCNRHHGCSSRSRAVDLGHDADRLRGPWLCGGAAKRRRARDLGVKSESAPLLLLTRDSRRSAPGRRPRRSRPGRT